MATYEITALSPRFIADMGFCLNDAGRVAGILKVGETSVDGERQSQTAVAICAPLRRRDQEPRVLPITNVPNRRELSIAGISQRGDVIGSVGATTSGAITVTVSDGILWPAGGRVTALTGKSGLSITQPNAINANGVIVGGVSSGSAMETQRLPDGSTGALISWAVRWKRFQLEILFAGVATAINDRDEVVGYSGEADLNGKALHWRDGKLQTLCDGMALAINNRGQVVGKQYVGRIRPDVSLPRTKAFSWQDGRLTLLRELPKSEESTAEAVNDRGEIIGACDDVPTLWREGKAIELQTLLPTRSGWQLMRVDGLNNQGQIVGVGELRGQKLGFLLTPQY